MTLMSNWSPARHWWKRWYRTLRIVRREHAKAVYDLMVYGACAVAIPEDGSDPYHIPVKNIPIEALQSGADTPEA